MVTIYASGNVNPNEAPPLVSLARVCSFVPEQALCGGTDPSQPLKFLNLWGMARMFAGPVPLFSRPNDFIKFLEGNDRIYQMIATMAGPEYVFAPIQVQEKDKRRKLVRAFTTAARIITVEATGRSGRATKRIRAVVNNHKLWNPPPPNTTKMTPLGILHYWRID